MNAKITTEEAQKFICDYYSQKGISTEPEDWEMSKKYKNFKGIMCRDFANIKQRVRAIVVVGSDYDHSGLSVIENENYEYFLRLLAEMPVFYYVPAICNDGLIFIFETVNHFDKNKQLSPHPERHHALLKRVLLKLFKEEDIFSVNNGLTFSFPHTDMEDAIRRLEKFRIKFNPELFDAIDDEKFQYVMPDIALAKFRFPEDEALNEEESINKIFAVISEKNEFILEDYARIRFLLKKVNVEEFPTVKRIALGFKKHPDSKLLAIFDFETNRKKAQKVVRDIWAKKINS